jgi:hypothetical protein
MRASRLLLLPLYFCLLTCLSAGEGQKVASPQGFSLDAPPAWVIATKENQEQVLRDYAGVLGKLGQLDFDRVAVLVFNPANKDFAENINVIVAPGKMPLDEMMPKMADMLKTEFKRLGLEPANITSERIKINGHDAISAKYEMTYPVPDAPKVKQWQVIVPGESKTYVFTCTAAASSYAQMEPLFSAALNSADVDTNSAKQP